MKNVLFILPWVPYPLNSGGAQGTFNGIALLEGMANAYVIVDCTESQARRGEHKLLEKVLPFVHTIPYTYPASRHTLRWYWRALCNKLGLRKSAKTMALEQQPHEDLVGLYREPLRGFSLDKQNFILDCIQRYHIDVVQAEYAECIRAVEFLPETVKKIFINHELRYVRDELLAKQNPNVTEADWDLLRKKKQQEVELMNRYDTVITVSAIDADKIREAGVTTEVLPSFSVISDKLKAVETSSVKKILSYVGPEGHFPNYDGVMWFLQNCWEKLMAKDPDYIFQIIGNWSKETADAIATTYPGVQCVGFVDNLAEAIVGTTMIVPLNIGSGIRMKILEAARLNVPVVATPVGAEGLAIEDGVHAYITADPEEFVEDILKLQDAKVRQRFVEATNETIAKKYSLQALREQRTYLYS